MWFPLEFQNFIAKKNLRDESCDIYVSDFVRIWHVLLSNNELILISKALNPLLEASVQKLRDITFTLLEDVKVKKEITEKNNNIFIKLESSIMGVKFKFQAILKPGNEEMLYNELTLPLLHLLLNVHNREKKLINIIKDKDAEIKDYKQDYGVRPDYIATEPFSEKKIDSEESKMDIFWDSNPLLDHISTRLLSNKGVPESKHQQQFLEEKLSRKQCVDKITIKKSIFQNKNLNQSKGSKPCLLLDNQIIKKRKNINEGYKIKF